MKKIYKLLTLLLLVLFLGVVIKPSHQEESIVWDHIKQSRNESCIRQYEAYYSNTSKGEFIIEKSVLKDLEACSDYLKKIEKDVQDVFYFLEESQRNKLKFKILSFSDLNAEPMVQSYVQEGEIVTSPEFTLS